MARDRPGRDVDFLYDAAVAMAAIVVMLFWGGEKTHFQGCLGSLEEWV